MTFTETPKQRRQREESYARSLAGQLLDDLLFHQPTARVSIAWTIDLGDGRTFIDSLTVNGSQTQGDVA